MFLFEGGFGNVLHTGDCRLTGEYLQHLPEKYLGKKGKKPRCQLDYVFLDCTFGKYYQSFPSKHSAIQQVLFLGSSYTCYSSFWVFYFYSQRLLFLKVMLKMEHSSLLFKIQDQTLYLLNLFFRLLLHSSDLYRYDDRMYQHFLKKIWQIKIPTYKLCLLKGSRLYTQKIQT